VLSTIAEDHPEVDYKLSMLGELNFGQCKGCYACIAHGEDKCPLKDDRDLVVDEMLAADGVVFASPVYVNHISALTKSFIDRTGYGSHRPRFFGKQADAAFEKLVAAIQSGARKPPSVTQVVMFHMFKAISSACLDEFSSRSPLLPGQERLL